MSHNSPRSRWKSGDFASRLTLAFTALAIAAMMLFGGGGGGLAATAVVAAVGLGLLGCILASSSYPSFQSQPLTVRVGIVGIAILPLLQLIPLPASWWQRLPGQELRVQTLALAGLADSWQPLTLTPLATSVAAIHAIAFAALLVILLILPALHLRFVTWFVLGIIGLNILVGLIQVASDGDALQFYRTSHRGALLGFFANKNHMALVLAASLPLAAFGLGARSNPAGTRVWLGLYAGLVLVALITTNSRAGLSLGIMTVAVLSLLYFRSIRWVYAVLLLVTAVAGTFVVSQTQAFDVIFDRFGAVEEDLRWHFLSTSLPIIETYWMFGSGIGSFSTLYAAGEQLSWVKPTYVNQLHNDYAQLLLEVGVPGWTLLLLLIGGCAQRAGSRWTSGEAKSRLPLVCGAWVLMLFAVHSAVDYPLRRAATLPVLALGAALVLRTDLQAWAGVSRRKQRA